MPDATFLNAGELAKIKARLRGGPSVPAAALPDLGIIFFSGLGAGDDPYDMLLDVARFADSAGFTAIWTPERHFTEVGGAYPNPAVLAAALATITSRVRLRAGSVNLPLHDVLRVAEEWAIVDNLSGGRVDLAVAPGWHATDFVLNPGGFEARAQVLNQAREQLVALWRGEAVERADPHGEIHKIQTFPRPVQPDLPIWLTSSKNPDSWRFAGENGLNVLTALINFGPPELEKRIAVYREARQRAGHDPAGGVVSVMLHTYVGADYDEAVARVRPALTAYLSSFVSQHATSGQSESRDRSRTLQELGDDRDGFLDMVFHRYVSTSSLIGDVDRARTTLESFAAMGVDELACLIDFGLPKNDVLAGLDRLATLMPGARS